MGRVGPQATVLTLPHPPQRVRWESGQDYETREVMKSARTNALIELSIEPTAKSDLAALDLALTALVAADPAISFSLDQEASQITIGGMSEMHLDEAITSLMHVCKEKLNVGGPQIAYREAFTRPTEIEFVHQRGFGSTRQYSGVKFRVLPQALNAAYEFNNQIDGSTVPNEYIEGFKRGIDSVRKNGLLVGFPTIGFKIELIGATCRGTDSSALAFENAARAALIKNKSDLGLTLLEPIMNVEVITPDEYSGSIIDDLNSRRGQIEGEKMCEGENTVSAKIPLSRMFGYINNLRAITNGQATYTTKFDCYAQVPQTVEGGVPPSATI